MSNIWPFALVVVTSATTAFRENQDFDDDDEDEPRVVNEPIRLADEHTKKQPKVIEPSPTNEPAIAGAEQQDEWEEFGNAKYDELRLKFLGTNNTDDDDDDDDDQDDFTAIDELAEASAEREQHKDRPVWKLDLSKQAEVSIPEVTAPPVKETPAPASSTSSYVPPHLRGGASVTVVSGGPAPRPKKKAEPNFASTDEFPTLGSGQPRK